MAGRLEPEPIARRDFLGLAGWWTAALAVLGSLAGMVRLPNPRVLPETSRRFRIGRSRDYPVGSMQVVPDKNVLLVSRREGFAAISMVCTHLGCIVDRSETGFACPCHGSSFAKDGSVVAGPAPRGLRWLEVSRSIDGRLTVDSGREVPAGTWFRA
ncbi:MAG: Rieske 2Fe-2S domain-containing protein [Proteobacteria bacterium]|nr:Rieske 2Fe-2S domain-containing protein [Pseudomonadota bacterium]